MALLALRITHANPFLQHYRDITNAYTNNYDLGELAQKHKQAANDL
jgi:hypothetical protein